MRLFSWLKSLFSRYKQIKTEFVGDNEPCENGGCCGCSCVPSTPTHKGNG